MSSRPPRRLATILVMVASLLFMQLALAGYACPTAIPDEAPAAMEMAPGVPCEAMNHPQDDPPSALCHDHCKNAAQTYEAVKLPAATLPAVVQAFILPLRVDMAQQEARAFATSGEAQPPPAPVFLSTSRLRV